ncbi:sensor histidine kinase [Winogradskya humida]|nr:HAMP domain-containing sensor histidine kinase [Actinoplanes humidus]
MDQPRRTARQRLVIMYAAMFLVSGTVLLALANVLGTVRYTRPAGAGPDLREQLAGAEAAQNRQLLAGSLIALAVMAAVSVLLGWSAARRVLRPLTMITTATRRITAENLHERLAVPGPADEVKDLADTIDDLLERLEVSFAAQRRFVAHASHELRTPLTTIRATLDVASAKPQAAAQTVALAERLRPELDRIETLLEGLLMLARAQHGTLSAGGDPAGTAEVELGALIERAVEARGADIAAKGLTVERTGDPGRTWGNHALLSRLVDNLIDNAVTHNVDGGWVRVSGDHARIVVESGGPVLDPARVARLGQPFQRLGEGIGAGSGSGLGLSIVAAVAGAHGGRLELHTRASGGLAATVTLHEWTPGGVHR